MAVGFRKSHLLWTKQLRWMEHFVVGATARTAAGLVGVNPNAAAYYFHRLRQIIVLATEDESPLSGGTEVDALFRRPSQGQAWTWHSRQSIRLWPVKTRGKVYALDLAVSLGMIRFSETVIDAVQKTHPVKRVTTEAYR